MHMYTAKSEISFYSWYFPSFCKWCTFKQNSQTVTKLWMAV